MVPSPEGLRGATVAGVDGARVNARPLGGRGAASRRRNEAAPPNASVAPLPLRQEVRATQAAWGRQGQTGPAELGVGPRGGRDVNAAVAYAERQMKRTAPPASLIVNTEISD